MAATTDPYKIHVNGQFDFELLPDDIAGLDILSKDENSVHFLLNGQSYHVEVVDSQHREFAFRIDGKRYNVKISDKYERLVQQMGLGAGTGHKQNTIKAPMPGLVFKIVAEAGQTVVKGDTLLILEAMKMENVIKAAGDGVVKAIMVKQGDPVGKGQVLVELE